MGYGSGFDLKHLTQDNKKSNLDRDGVMIVGLDISMNMLLQARKWLSENGLQAHLIQADACFLPFRDETYDLVHSHELSVFNYGSADDRVIVLSEQWRVNKPGGIIVTVLPQRDQEGFLPTEEPQMRYLFRSAGI